MVVHYQVSSLVAFSFSLLLVYRLEYRQTRPSTNMLVILLRQCVLAHLIHCPIYLESSDSVVCIWALGAFCMTMFHPWAKIQRVIKLSSSAACNSMRPSHRSFAKPAVKGAVWMIWVRIAAVRPERQDIPPSMCASGMVRSLKRCSEQGVGKLTSGTILEAPTFQI